MAERRWTDRQKQSIEARGGTLLISAAAGSGKTAVLVERVIRRITDPTDPVDVDRLLIVTFTRAAAAEMQQRLSAALAAKMADDPANTLYQRQQMLLPRAHISTVHGFCAALLREQAGAIGLPPRFRVAEEAETALLSSEALDTVLEQSYREQDPAFLALAAQLGGGRSDDGLRSAVLEAYEFMQAQPFPQAWLREQLDTYTAVQPLENTRWMPPLRQELQYILEGCCQLADRCCALAARDGLEAYADALAVDAKAAQNLSTLAVADTGYDALQQAVCAASLTRLPPVRSKDTAVIEDKEQIKALRDRIKKKLERAKKLFFGSEAECRADLAAMAPVVDALGGLVTRYTEEFTRRKRQKKLLDYNDLEHESLRLLLDGESCRPTPLAEELSGRFAEIMVDEYQDTNAAQDALFRALSRQESNLFMVGDVKQSIYGFRQAMPTIFTARRDHYTEYDAAHPAFPAAITLGNNFRSRETVTDTVNFLFRQLMHRSLGGVEYDEREALVCSADYPPAEGRETEWLLLDEASAAGDVPEPAVAEARAIGRRIRELMDTMTIKGEDGERLLRYGDIGILLRARTKANIFIRELGLMGIPVGADSSSAFLTTPEIATALSLLRVIDNPLREVELTALLLSPLGGFTADDCARIRLDGGKELSLFAALQAKADATPQPGEPDDLQVRCGRLLQLLRRARTLAVTLPVDRLLERLYRDTGLLAVFAARPGGRQRVANLHQLDRLARSFEQGEFRGLSAFVRYIDRLQEQKRDLPAGGALRPDGVRLMTVHNSKGLEFPVVFLARLSGKMNADDTRRRLLFHQQAGIGLCLRDEDAGEKHRTLPFAAVLSARQQDSRAEELRVWYVAMTRAREKLCCVISSRDLRRQLAGLEEQLTPAREIPPEALLSAAAPADWFLLAALRHPSFAALRQHPEHTATLAAAQPFRLVFIDPSADTEAVEAAAPPTPTADSAFVAALRERLAYRYPHAALAAVPAKLAASQLSHETMSRQHIAAARPAFLQQEGLTAAQKGTALHTFMQFADFTQAESDPAAEAERLAAAGFLTARQAEVLPLDKLRRFFADPLFARMKASPDCRREYHFFVQVPAKAVAPEAGETEEQVVVQGIADCVFREGDGLVLLDYKTDRVSSPQELADRYRSQLYFYRQALEPLFGLPVTQAVLYSFHLGTTVPVTL